MTPTAFASTSPRSKVKSSHGSEFEWYFIRVQNNVAPRTGSVLFQNRMHPGLDLPKKSFGLLLRHQEHVGTLWGLWLTLLAETAASF